MTDEDELTEAERRALDGLPAESRVPAGFEERVVESLRARGLLGAPRRQVLRLGLAAGLFGSGLGTGFFAARRLGPTPELGRGPFFLLLLYPGPRFVAGQPADEAARVAEYGAWVGRLRRGGQMVGAEKLKDGGCVGVSGLQLAPGRVECGTPVAKRLRSGRDCIRMDLLASVVAAAAAVVAASSASPTDPVAYQVELARAGDSSVAVSITLPAAVPGPVSLVIPRAVPMGYSQQLYDRYVTDLTGRGDDDAAVPVAREDGPRWRIGARGGSVRRVAYRVDLARMEREILGAADSSRARPGYVGLLGYSVFGYLEGRESRPVTLEVKAPSDWPVFTTLAPQASPPRARVTAAAADFYALADSQVAMGPALEVLRLESRVPLYLAAYAEGPADLAFTGSLVARALDALVSYFGSAPFPHYTAQVELLKPVSPDHGYGFSMEHLASSHYFVAADASVTPQSPELLRRRVLFNFAHHIAHAWIPKRAYGEGYFPFSWELAPLIDTIWLSEGFARYIAIEALADAMPEPDGLAYRRAMLDSLRATVAGMPAFIREMPLVQLSRIASTRYSEDFRTGRTLFSRGALLAAELDDEVRAASGGRKRFRDVARQLMEWSAVERRGFRVAELPGLVREATGVDTLAVWQRFLPGEL